MKIAIIIAAFTPSTIYGGPVSVALGHAKGLRARGHDVTILTSDLLNLAPEKHVTDSAREIDGILVRYFRSSWIRPRLPLVRSCDLVSWVRANHAQFDVFHIHFAREWIPVRAAQVLLHRNRPVFLQPHGMLNKRDGIRRFIDLAVIRRLLRKSTRVFALQDYEHSTLKAISADSHVVTVANGISPSFPFAPRERPRTPPTILFLARLHPRKRVLAFVEMAAQLKGRGISARYRVVGPDGGDLPRAEELATRLGVSDLIEFIGALPSDRTSAEYKSADVYVLPSVDEPFPMTVLEAIQAGLPTIVTNSCHIAPILAASGAAIVSSPEPAALASAVARLLSSNDAGYASLSLSAIETVKSTFSHEAVITTLEREYEHGTVRAH